MVTLWQDCSLESGQAEAHLGNMSESGHRSCECGAVYDRSEHIAEAREISSFECVVCGKTIENWNSAWVPRYRFIACPATESE
jgi:stage III sporulation protein SpoIIIAA